MTKLLLCAATAALLAVLPAMAEKKSATSKGASAQSELLQQEGQNREPGEDGTFQGKPVVEGPADWSSVHMDGAPASSGASSGEAGSDQRDDN